MERRNLESAAASYPYLRGLLAIPVGMLFVPAGLANLGWGPFGQTWVFPCFVLLAGVAYWLITRYYQDTYGRVTPSRRSQVRDAVATLLNAVVVGGGVQLDWSVDLPVSCTAASFALAIGVNYAISLGLRARHVVIWGALLVAGLLPVWGDAGGSNRINVGLVLVGVATMATGVVDHLALRRTFGPSKDLEDSNVKC